MPGLGTTAEWASFSDTRKRRLPRGSCPAGDRAAAAHGEITGLLRAICEGRWVPSVALYLWPDTYLVWYLGVFWYLIVTKVPTRYLVRYLPGTYNPPAPLLGQVKDALGLPAFGLSGSPGAP